MRDDWNEVKLADCCDFANGLWKGKKPPYMTVGVIRNTNFSTNGQIDYSKIAYLEVEVSQYSKRCLEYGDIILEKSGGGPKQPVGRVVSFEKKEGDFSLSNFTSLIRVKDAKVINFKFLHKLLHFYYLSGMTEGMQRQSTGIRNLSFKEYKEIPIPLPPLPEQERIVSILDKAFEGIDKAIAQTEQNLASARELFESYLNNIFTQKGDDWVEKKLTEIGKVSTGKHDANHATEQGRYRFYTCAYKYLACDTNSFHGPALILAGNGANVGEVFYYEGEFDAYQRTYVVHDIEIEPKYLFYHLKAFWRERNLNKQYGSATNYLKIGNFSDYQVTYPCLQKQRETIKLIESISFRNQQLQALYTQKLNDLKELKQSLLQQAFAGELTKEDAA